MTPHTRRQTDRLATSIRRDAIGETTVSYGLELLLKRVYALKALNHFLRLTNALLIVKDARPRRYVRYNTALVPINTLIYADKLERRFNAVEREHLEVTDILRLLRRYTHYRETGHTRATYVRR